MTAPQLDRGLSRRAFAKAAVAIGGTSALAACMDRYGTPDVPQGPSDLSTLPDRQHAWNEFLSTDDHGNPIVPRHRVLLLLNYTGDGRLSSEERDAVEAALQSLEHAYQRGNDGLLFTVGYSPAYFERFDEELPAAVDLPQPEALSSLEDPTFDQQDAVIHLGSDYAQVVLAAEEALFGEQETLNGVEMEVTLTDVFTKADRRTGFVGKGLPADNQDVSGIPSSKPVSEDAPLYMGFKSGFQKNQASEDRVTIQESIFAGGTTFQLSRIDLQLEQWYEQDSRDQRVTKMFCPVHVEKNLVEGAGDNLGDSSKMTDECIEDVEEFARTHGIVGHSQKSAQARKDDSPVIIHRDFNSTDGGEAGLHFISLQRTISDFADTREAMNGSDVAANSAIGQKTNNGILQYMSVKRRGNFLLPRATSEHSHQYVPRSPHVSPRDEKPLLLSSRYVQISRTRKTQPKLV